MTRDEGSHDRNKGSHDRNKGSNDRKKGSQNCNEGKYGKLVNLKICLQKVRLTNILKSTIMKTEKSAKSNFQCSTLAIKRVSVYIRNKQLNKNIKNNNCIGR